MSFWIQASNPCATGQHDPDDHSLADAIQTAFPLQTECALLFWNHVPVVLDYRSDLSVCMRDIVQMLSQLRASSHGELTIEWPSSSFHARWQLHWSDSQLTVASHWIAVAGDVAPVLNRRPSIDIASEHFIAEWREPLARVLHALRASSYEPAQLPELAELERLYASIPRAGVLYTAPT